MAKKTQKDPNRIDKTHPDYLRLLQEWQKEDKPVHLRIKQGNFHAFRDNDELFFIKEEDQQDNFSSFGKVF